MKKDTNRQVRIPGPRDHDVAEHCRRNGMRLEDEKDVKAAGKTRSGARDPLELAATTAAVPLGKNQRLQAL